MWHVYLGSNGKTRHLASLGDRWCGEDSVASGTTHGYNIPKSQHNTINQKSTNNLKEGMERTLISEWHLYTHKHNPLDTSDSTESSNYYKLPAVKMSPLFLFYNIVKQRVSCYQLTFVCEPSWHLSVILGRKEIVTSLITSTRSLKHNVTKIPQKRVGSLTLLVIGL